LDKYLLNLYKQFCDARGIICNPFEFNRYTDEFVDWVAHNKRITEKYREYLLSLGYIDGKTVSEVGKGMYDSLQLIGSVIVSPYAETIGFDNSELFIIGNYPLIQQKGSIVRPNTEILLTNNPYEEMQIINWFKVHNSKIYDVSIGMYGNIHDSNFAERVRLLEEISKRMDDDHAIDYDTDQDNYFCSINSKRMIKERKKVLTM